MSVFHKVVLVWKRVVMINAERNVGHTVWMALCLSEFVVMKGLVVVMKGFVVVIKGLVVVMKGLVVVIKGLVVVMKGLEYVEETQNVEQC